jgi:hypothetical protein
MFGNLSKSLIKAPHYFNNNIETEANEYSKISRNNNLLDTYSNIRKKSNRRKEIRYFKERDFIKKNLRLDLNYNNNFRKEITPLVRTKHCVSFEEFIFGNLNNSKNITKKSMYRTNNSIKSNNTNTNRSIATRSNVTKLSEFTYNKENMKNYRDYLEKKLFPKEKVEKFNFEMKSNINNLFEKINQNALKEYINRITVVESPVKLKFPEIKIKSQDALYREALDEKIKSLSMIKPKIKEQLKNKKRVFASKKDYYRYNNSYYSYKTNPFNETVKYMEEINKKEYI